MSDYYNNVVRYVNSSGWLSSIAGSPSGASGWAGDGGLALSSLIDGPNGIARDSDSTGWVIADTTRSVIRRLTLVQTISVCPSRSQTATPSSTPKPWYISSLGGTGTTGFSGDGGMAVCGQMWDGAGDVSSDGAGGYLVVSLQEQFRRLGDFLSLAHIFGIF